MENNQDPQAGQSESVQPPQLKQDIRSDVVTPAEPSMRKGELPTILLASASVRRAEILRRVGWDFTAIAADIDETRAPGEDAIQYVRRLANEKARKVARTSPGQLVLGADTTVVLGKDVLEKPLDDNDARRMLRSLSGCWHTVVTGVAMISPNNSGLSLVNHDITRVLFAALSDDEINAYVETGEPMDKAGAYAIQGHASLFIERVEGDFWNIVGLPIRLVYKMAHELNAM